jgi:alpha-ketoglutarate-dependent taurine dioxygenase
MTYGIEQLSPELGFGKIVRGLQSADIAKESVRAELRRAWVNDGLLVFRDGEISDDFQVGLSLVFGRFKSRPIPILFA